MNIKRFLFLGFISILAGCSSSAVTTKTTYTGNITGSVILQGQNVYKDVLVYISGEPYIVYTDVNGNYSITDIPAGTYMLNASKTGYASAYQQITLNPGQTLKASPMVLDILATSFSVKTPFTAIEDQPFTITVSAMLDNNILPTYSGTVNLDSSWGDITPTTVSSFSGGTKTFSAWVNREGPAAISFSDTTSPYATSAAAINVLSIPWRLGHIPDVDLSGTGWDNTHVSFPSVIYVNGEFYMLYSGSNGTSWNIGLATSADGITWSKSTYNPVIKTGGTFYASGVLATSIMYENGMFKTWFSGSEGSYTNIGYATSANCITWTVDSSPVLITGSTGLWDYKAVTEPSVINDNGVYKMWYSGYDGNTWRIGYATSTDGITWAKYGYNGTDLPVIDASSSGADSSGVYAPTVVKDGNVYKMYYTGIDTSGNLTLNYATSTDGITWFKSTSNPKLSYGSGVQSPDFILRTMFLYLSYYDGTHWRIGLATYP